MKAAIYARVSTQDQHCEVQLRELRDYCKRRGWKKPAEYIDSGFSGSKASRPALDKLMRDAADRQIEMVMVSKLDRFGRSVLNLSQQIQQLDSYKVRFLAITQGIDTDQANPTSRLLLHILSAVAEFEREIIRERTRAGLAHAKASGKILGRPKKVFRRDLVAGLREKGKSWRKIATLLGVSLSTLFDSVRPEIARVKKRSEKVIRPKTTHKSKQRT